MAAAPQRRRCPRGIRRCPPLAKSFGREPAYEHENIGVAETKYKSEWKAGKREKVAEQQRCCTWPIKWRTSSELAAELRARQDQPGGRCASNAIRSIAKKSPGFVV